MKRKFYSGYAEFEGHTKTFIIKHIQGVGVIESPFVEKEIMFETDDEKEAEKQVIKLKKYYNSPEDLETTWYSNRYQIQVNTLTDKGKELHKEFLVYLEKLKKQITKNSKDTVTYTIEHEDNTKFSMTVLKNDKMDNNHIPVESHRITWLDFSNLDKAVEECIQYKK
jgi:hypothetical protein